MALFPLTPCGTESEVLSHALEATRLPQRAEGPSEVGRAVRGWRNSGTQITFQVRGHRKEAPSSEGEAVRNGAPASLPSVIANDDDDDDIMMI